MCSGALQLGECSTSAQFDDHHRCCTARVVLLSSCLSHGRVWAARWCATAG
jgi:hypothetical protein